VKAYVGTFRLRNGTGSQTVTGIVDEDGNPFTPAIIMFQSGGNVLNTLYYNPTGSANTTSSDKSWYRSADNSAGSACFAEYPFNAAVKVCGGNAGTGVNSVFTSYEADIFFAGTLYRTASMTSVASGEFTISLTAAYGWFEPTDVMITVFGGDDLETELLTFGGAGAYGTSFESKGFFSPRIDLGTTGTNANGAGSAIAGFGWDSPNGGASANCSHIGFNDTNWRYQRTNAYRVDINGGAGTTSQSGAISAWDEASVTTPTSYSVQGLSIGGENVITASGAITEPLATGPQTITLGIAAKWIVFSSVGAPASAVLDTGTSQMLCGWGTNDAQTSYWLGETSGATAPLKGAMLLADDYIIRLSSAGANAGSTVFDGLATLVALNEDGTADLDWDAVTGTGVEIIWFAIGGDAGFDPPDPPDPPDPLNPFEWEPCVPADLSPITPGIGDGQ
jgi:hypothetical protein